VGPGVGVPVPDPLGLSPEAGEDLLQDLSGGKRATEVISKWLSEDDAAFVTKHLSLREMLEEFGRISL